MLLRRFLSTRKESSFVLLFVRTRALVAVTMSYFLLRFGLERASAGNSCALFSGNLRFSLAICSRWLGMSSFYQILVLASICRWRFCPGLRCHCLFFFCPGQSQNAGGPLGTASGAKVCFRAVETLVADKKRGTSSSFSPVVPREAFPMWLSWSFSSEC